MSASGNYRQLIMSESLSLHQHCSKGETEFIKTETPGSELPKDKKHAAVLWLTLP